MMGITIIAGILVSVVGKYVPFMLLGSLMLTIGCGFCTTLTSTTDRAHWVGYVFLAGAGVGMGLNQPETAAQTVFDIADVPTSTAIILSCQILGGAIFLSVGNSVLDNRFLHILAATAPHLDALQILDAGVTGFLRQDQLGLDSATQVLVAQAFNTAATETFRVAAVLGGLSFLAALGMEWKSVKEETGV
jgi:hypothetical protein